MLIKSNYIVGSESLKKKKSTVENIESVFTILLQTKKSAEARKQTDNDLKNKERTYNGKNIDKK